MGFARRLSSTNTTTSSGKLDHAALSLALLRGKLPAPRHAVPIPHPKHTILGNSAPQLPPTLPSAIGFQTQTAGAAAAVQDVHCTCAPNRPFQKMKTSSCETTNRFSATTKRRGSVFKLQSAPPSCYAHCPSYNAATTKCQCLPQHHASESLHLNLDLQMHHT